MRWWHIPFSLLYKLWFGIVFFGSMLLLYPVFKYYLKTKKYRRVFKWERIWSKIIRVLTFMPFRIEYRDKLPDPPYIICANHSSYIDTVTMFSTIPEYFLFMGKSELLHWPLFRIFFYDMNIAVNRKSPSQALKAFRKAHREIAKGTSIAIFPEGGIPEKAPRLGRFKDGAFRLAIEHQIPIVPVSFPDNHRIFGEPTDLKSRALPGRGRAIIHKSIDTAGLTSTDLVNLREEVREILAQSLRDHESR